MFDCYKREINYLRLSITSACQLHCLYCRPRQAGPRQRLQSSAAHALTRAEIREIAHIAVKEFSFSKIRITGGEPLLRTDVVDIVSDLNELRACGLNEINITTNAIAMGEREGLALALRRAGLDRLNISLDTLDRNLYSELTGGDDYLPIALAGIERARLVALGPIKINTVIGEWTRESDLQALAQYCLERGFKQQLIKRMSLAGQHFAPVEGGEGGRCERCNRLRVTAEGWVRPCLMSAQQFSLRELGVAKAFQLALGHKPLRGDHETHPDHLSTFSEIGG